MSNRYSCQINLPNFGVDGQLMLKAAKVLVVGIGGLGCPTAQYLAAAGIGTLGLADGDSIQERNLNRQVLFYPNEIGQQKVVVAASKLSSQNQDISIVQHACMLQAHNSQDIISQYDVVVDCCDNFDTRYLLNDVCVQLKKPLFYGAIYQYEGQLAVWNVPCGDGKYSANYRDVFPESNAAAIPDCNDGGVIPTLAGIVGCMQANEVIKYLTGIGELAINQLCIIDAHTLDVSRFTIPRATGQVAPSVNKMPEVLLLSHDTLKTALPGSYYLVDVRDTEERMQQHIGGLHMPLTEILNGNWHPDTDKAIVLYCASGKRSAIACRYLHSELGLHAYSLQNGIEGWQVE